MNRRILIVLNHADRERRWMQKIQRAIEEYCPEAKVEMLDARDPMFALKAIEAAPRVVMTFPFTAITTSLRFYILKHLTGCVIVSFRAEGVVNCESAEKLRIFAGLERYGTHLVDYEVFWGPKAAQAIGCILVEQNKLQSLERTRCFGAPHYEDYVNPPDANELILPQNIEQRLAPYGRDKIVLFATGFQYADYSPRDVLNAGDLVDIHSAQAQQQFNTALAVVEMVKRLRHMWIETIGRCATEHADLLFLVKTHPVENIIFARGSIPNPYRVLEQHANVCLLTETVPFRAVASRSCLHFHYGSTTSLEAYLLHIPSVFVLSRELGMHEDHSLFSTEIGIPFVHTVDISEVPSLVSDHAVHPIAFRRDADMERTLEEQLDLRVGHEYLPSRAIARFLLSLVDEPALPALGDREYLRNALAHLGAQLASSMCALAAPKIEHGQYRDALADWLDHAHELCSVGGFHIRSLEFLRGACLVQDNRPQEALNALRLELGAFPDHKRAADLSRAIQQRIFNNASAMTEERTGAPDNTRSNL
jgi:hypothetical protein